MVNPMSLTTDTATEEDKANMCAPASYSQQSAQRSTTQRLHHTQASPKFFPGRISANWVRDF
jgi:hypothetical protein